MSMLVPPEGTPTRAMVHFPHGGKPRPVESDFMAGTAWEWGESGDG